MDVAGGARGANPAGANVTDRNRAFLAADMIVAISIVGMLMILLVTTISQINSAQRRLADSRSAQRLAEHALLALQLGQPLPAPVDAEAIEIRPATGGEAPRGYKWVVARTNVGGRQAEVFGIVPSAADAAGAPK
jgi:type II secretory pathway pseudopilin PulG